MLYTLLIYQAEEEVEAMSAAEEEAALAEHRKLHEVTRGNGTFVAASRLVPTGAATTLRRKDGAAQLIDGPFAETKEQLLGFYILDCASLEEATGYAKMLPSVPAGCIEVRPIMYMSDLPEKR